MQFDIQVQNFAEQPAASFFRMEKLWFITITQRLISQKTVISILFAFRTSNIAINIKMKPPEGREDTR